GEDRPAKCAHEPHLIGRADIGARSPERGEVDDHGVTPSHRTFYGAADGKTPLRERQRQIASVFLVGGEHPDQAVAFTDGAFARADVACIGEEDLGTGEIDALGHGLTSVPEAAGMVMAWLDGGPRHPTASAADPLASNSPRNSGSA